MSRDTTQIKEKIRDFVEENRTVIVYSISLLVLVGLLIGIAGTMSSGETEDPIESNNNVVFNVQFVSEEGDSMSSVPYTVYADGEEVRSTTTPRTNEYGQVTLRDIDTETEITVETDLESSDSSYEWYPEEELPCPCQPEYTDTSYTTTLSDSVINGEQPAEVDIQMERAE